MSMALETDHLRVRANALFKQFKRHGTTDSSGRLLVVGAGGGANAARFGKEFGETHCCDINLRLVEDSGSHVTQADGTRLPYADDSMAASIAISVIEHVLPFSERPRLIAELVRVTEPGGTVFIQIPNNNFPVELHTKLPFIQWIPGGVRVAAHFATELKYIDIPDPEQLEEWATAANADVNALEPLVYPPDAVPAFQGVYAACAHLGLWKWCPTGWTLSLTPRPTSCSQRAVDGL